MTEHPLASTPSMEARLIEALPEDGDWQYEPKWDGFRAIVSRQGASVTLMSRSGKSLSRYFPEIVAGLLACREESFVLDGELILPIGGILSFGALQARLHPAESRVRKLARETPAQLMLFDCLAVGNEVLLTRPLSDRRAALERFHSREASDRLLLSPATIDLAAARRWLAQSGGALDGVVAKDRGAPYLPGERAMLKVKQIRSADCVVGGFRYAKAGKAVGSLLLGLHDDRGLLHHVGFTSSFTREEGVEMVKRLEPLIMQPGFTGNAPGGPSRWSGGKASAWQPLKAELVVEVAYDQVTGNRFRHGTRLLRWRPDKLPAQCRLDQLVHELRPTNLPDFR